MDHADTAWHAGFFVNVGSWSLHSADAWGPRLVCTEATMEAKPVCVCLELALSWGSELSVDRLREVMPSGAPSLG